MKCVYMKKRNRRAEDIEQVKIELWYILCMFLVVVTYINCELFHEIKNVPHSRMLITIFAWWIRKWFCLSTLFYFSNIAENNWDKTNDIAFTVKSCLNKVQEMIVSTSFVFLCKTTGADWITQGQAIPLCSVWVWVLQPSDWL